MTADGRTAEAGGTNMPEVQSPSTADRVDLDTCLSGELRVPANGSGRWVAGEFAYTMAEVGIPVERETGDGEFVVRYRYSIEQALRLGSSWRSPEALLQELLREYPALAADRDRLRQRLEVLRTEHEESG